MILTNYLLSTGLSYSIITPCYYLIYPFFRVRRQLVFAIVMGFLCGFPIGAKITASLYRQGELSKKEADFLLAFTNNIGPAYYIAYLYPLLFSGFPIFLLLFLQFAIPFIYGFILRYTFFHDIPARQSDAFRKPRISFRAALFDTAIKDATGQIIALGGYMILFNVFARLIYQLPVSQTLICLLHMGTEISTGINQLARLNQLNPFPNPVLLLYVQGFLSFGGLCCLYQTISILTDTDLSIKKYMLHKVLLCSITSCIIIFLNQVKLI